MALSKQVEESLKAAETNLREALAFAARSERPFLIRELGALISHLDTVMSTDTMFDKLDAAIIQRETEEES